MFRPSLERSHVIFGSCIDIEIAPRPLTCEDQTGGVVWPVNYVMTKFIEDFKIPLSGRRVIELGAGTGILSIAAAVGGAEVTATELPDFIPMLLTNVARNSKLLAEVQLSGKGSGKVDVVGHRWGEDTDALGGPFDLVLCCELLYWGGWSLLASDTREPLLRSITGLTSACKRPSPAGRTCEPANTGPIAAGPGGAALGGFAVRNAAREREFFVAAAAAFAIRYCHLSVGGDAAPAAGGTAGWMCGGSWPALREELPQDVEEGDVVIALMQRRRSEG